MKKRFGIAVAFIMVIVLCLALTGCGQNTSKPATSNNDVVQPDVSGGENHEENTTSTQEPVSPPAGIDNKNPQQDVNGLWASSGPATAPRTRASPRSRSPPRAPRIPAPP